MTNEYNPDFIAGTEFWLSSNINSSEIFLPLTILSDGTEMIVMEEFLSHANLPLFVRKFQ